jgi:hypothetical protein
MVIKFKYKETEIPVSVGYYALKRYKMDTGKEFTELESDDLETLEVLFWYALEAGYKQEGKENPFKREDAELILDAVLMEFVARIPDFFLQSPTIPSLTKGTETGKTSRKQGKK